MTIKSNKKTLNLFFMDAQKVDMFIMTSGKFFEGHHLGIIRDRMLEAPENKFVNLQMAQFKDPTKVLII